ncbi:hypothetical protein NC99_15200 [Sunxiuqinia dokdonensis]|uniref:Uncharacterized protein n=1 Tax=Sunxiuqinia dokdonensis TaxID=1409788 RepID=A0A0L8VB34_9BACT|nr:hypothetical protein NC99_15200 [Sunxiuqinia dokdonensis]
MYRVVIVNITRKDSCGSIETALSGFSKIGRTYFQMKNWQTNQSA